MKERCFRVKRVSMDAKQLNYIITTKGIKHEQIAIKLNHILLTVFINYFQPIPTTLYNIGAGFYLKNVEECSSQALPISCWRYKFRLRCKDMKRFFGRKKNLRNQLQHYMRLFCQHNVCISSKSCSKIVCALLFVPAFSDHSPS